MAKNDGDRGDGDLTAREEAALDADARRAIQARASPEGLVAILFTDDVGSTRIRQRLGDQAAQERMRQHNQAVRAQIAKHGGFEVKTWGDAFMVVFSDVAVALACSVDIQRAVAEDNERHPNERIEVRLGLNAGQAIKEEEDFFGGAVVVAARLQGLAKGGQILVSEAVRVLAGLPEGIGYVRQGRRQLKGLEGSYDIWRVPWREEQPSVLARLWARPAFRVAAPLLLLAAIGGGVAGGVVLSGGGGGDIVYQEITFRGANSVPAGALAENTSITGDCVTEDLVVRARDDLPPDPGPGVPLTGDFSGHVISTDGSTTLFAVDACRSGFSTLTSILTDSDGNQLFVANAATVSLTLSPDEEAYSVVGKGIATVTGGSGTWEGVSGGGTCSSVTVGATATDAQGEALGPSSAAQEIECTLQVTTDPRARATAPLVAGLAVASPSVAVFGSATDDPTTLDVLVAYWNGGTEPLTNLSLRLPVPEGTEIVTSTRVAGEEETGAAGERVWPLPDLLPQGEVRQFLFLLQFISAEEPAVQLAVEIDGDGFDRPVRSDPVTIEVVQ